MADTVWTEYAEPSCYGKDSVKVAAVIYDSLSARSSASDGAAAELV